MKKKLIFILVTLLMWTTWAQAESLSWALALHGGAGASTDKMTSDEVASVEKALEQALQAGADHLAAGGSALDCVELVVRLLEDAPEFNAGRGAVFNSHREHELDASIMDGQTRNCGAVGAVRTVKNPIALARKVMTETRHVFLISDGAEQFATEQGVERVENSYFSTEARLRDLKNLESQGTVGCVALDQKGNLAAATSTGGLTGKKWGRLGDSPVIGAGTYADNRSCAVSGTGVGEEFIRRSLAFDVSARMLYGNLSLEEAAQKALDSLPQGTGGLIAVGADGTVITIFNTPGMARGSADSTGRFQTGIGRNSKSKASP